MSTVSALVIAVVLAAVSPAAVTASPAWIVVPTPNPTVPTGSLSAVSCPDKNVCMSVGTYPGSSGYVTPFAAIRSSRTWTLQGMPVPAGSTGSFLNSVSCASSTFCMAAGYFTNSDSTQSPLVEAWNGTNWFIQAAPGAPGASFTQLWGVACAAATSCMAVGNYSFSSPISGLNAFAESWDGTRWSVSAVEPESTQLSAVACSDSKHCLAVGTFASESTFAMQWNGSAWTFLTTATVPGIAELSGVSCTGAKSCIAVGWQNAGSATGGVPLTLVEQWNGSKWRVLPTPNPAGTIGAFLDSVSCDWSGCTAAGYYEPPFGLAPILTLIESWDGATWSIRTTPNPPNTVNALFLGISCPTQPSCVAAGYYVPIGSEPAGPPSFTLAESLGAGMWSIQATPNPSGALGAGLNGVSCPAASTCEAVGFTADEIGRYVPMAESWNGSQWSVQTVPSAAVSSSQALNAVSCASAVACVAVGNFYDGDGNSQIFADSFDGATWTAVSPGIPTASVSGQLTSVSCSAANSCIAVGSYSTTGSDELPLAESWDGASWTIQTVPVPIDNQTTFFYSVSCPYSAACVAVGISDRRSSSGLLAEIWNGTTWSMQTTATPLGFFPSFSSVSCWSPSACQAVGSFNPGTGYSEPFAEAWDGSSWTLRDMPTPASTLPAQMKSISCSSASACIAVGSRSDSSLKDFTLAESWDGSTWSIVTTPSPPGPEAAILKSVSCATSCMAVGLANNVTLAMSS